MTPDLSLSLSKFDANLATICLRDIERLPEKVNLSEILPKDF